MNETLSEVEKQSDPLLKEQSVTSSSQSEAESEKKARSRPCLSDCEYCDNCDICCSASFFENISKNSPCAFIGDLLLPEAFGQFSFHKFKFLHFHY